MLILARHGNTFEAGETPVWVGARTDLPLTPTGEAQASAAGEYIAKNFPAISAIIAGPLQRTQRTAAIIAGELQRGDNAYVIDQRLREIDYGLWEGLSGETIIARFGAQILEQWERDSVWPQNMEWQPSLPILHEQLTAFLSDMRIRLADGKSIVAVTSNGILRLIHSLITGDATKAIKVKTGHLCVLKPENKTWHVMEWNKNPAI